MIPTLGFVTLLNRTTISLEYIGVITGHINGIKIRNDAFGIILTYYIYLTYFPSENDEHDYAHDLATVIISGVFHQDNWNILVNG